MKIPESENSIANLIDGYYEDNEDDSPRGHIGPSQLGHVCDRYLWLGFRWAIKSKFSGRMLRLFERGREEEFKIFVWLRNIGVDVRPSKNKCYQFNLGGHVAGEPDGIVKGGVPGAEKTQHVLECKTHNAKSFNDLVAKGVKQSKYTHYVQMQIYMYALNIDRALYFAVCKDDDRIHTERIELDKVLADKYIERGKKIALTERMPDALSNDPTHWQCKMCNYYDFCHKSHKADNVNCRTCSLVTPKDNGTFICTRYDDYEIAEEDQRKGCDSHVLHPDLVPWEIVPSGYDYEAVYLIGDVPVRNGEPDANVFSSREILANPEACAINDETIIELRNSMGATITEDDIPL